MSDQYYYIYMLSKERNSTFYVGFTTNLLQRVFEHTQGIADGFTKKYGVKKLVYYEQHIDRDEALYREKLIQKWKRRYKMSAIESINPDWRDLYYDLIEALL